MSNNDIVLAGLSLSPPRRGCGLLMEGFSMEEIAGGLSPRQERQPHYTLFRGIGLDGWDQSLCGIIESSNPPCDCGRIEIPLLELPFRRFWGRIMLLGRKAGGG